MPPSRVDAFDVYEFHVIIAEEKGLFTAIGWDFGRKEIARMTSSNLDDLRNDIKRSLGEKSEQFVGYPGAINLFRRVFPDGFQDAFFLFDERNYKVRAHEKAKATLAKQNLAQQISKNQFLELGENARKVFTNLIFPNEVMAFKSFISIEKNAEAFSPLFFDLLYGNNFDASFDDLTSLLATAGAAKWTILTYWPFILFPDRHMFMKPEIAQGSARRLGDDFGYESRPSSKIYRKYLQYIGRLREGISELQPRDNIDVQTLMYVVAKPGFVREGIERRADWLAKQP